MNEPRLDHLTRQRTYVVGHRQGRPNRPSTDCPFCVGGLESPEPYDVRWFVNRWPAMPDERCEMVLYTPDHDAEFWALGVEGARKVVDLWAERTAALGSRDDVDYVLVFENRGADAGATIPHPHGQIYAYPEVPPVPLRELVDGVLLPDRIPDELVVGRHGDWLTWVPEAPTWPYELRLAPRTEAPDLVDGRCDRDGLAAALVDGLARLDQLFDEPMPYMLWIHQRPTDGGDWPGARVHVHVNPMLRAPGVLRYVAAAEQGGGVQFDPIDPVDAAAQLRGLPGAPTGSGDRAGDGGDR
jgi:UDPglucose--hexose-1-phosphate uridylyltransferase